jgi:hypothetical protein
MIKCAYCAALMAAICFAASSGCCTVEKCCGMHCGTPCGSDCGNCDTGSCASCGHCGMSSCGTCNGGCGGDSACDTCGGGCDSCNSCGHGVKDCWWPLNLSWVHELFGCCKGCYNGCCHPETYDCGCGCGEPYWCDWKGCPPTPDPCDSCGCYAGCSPCANRCYQASPRYGSISWPPHDDGGMVDGEAYVGQKPKATTAQ